MARPEVIDYWIMLARLHHDAGQLRQVIQAQERAVEEAGKKKDTLPYYQGSLQKTLDDYKREAEKK